MSRAFVLGRTRRRTLTRQIILLKARAGFTNSNSKNFWENAASSKLTKP